MYVYTCVYAYTNVKNQAQSQWCQRCKANYYQMPSSWPPYKVVWIACIDRWSDT